MAGPREKVGNDSTAVPPAARASASLFEIREKLAARVVQALFEPKELVAIAGELGLNPLPGKRLKTMTATDHAILLVRTLQAPSKHQSLVSGKVLSRLPAPLVKTPEELTAETVEKLVAMGPDVALEARLSALVTLALDPTKRDLLQSLVEKDFLKRSSPEAAAENGAIAGSGAVAPSPQEDDPRAEEIRKLAERAARLERDHEKARAQGDDRERSLKLRIDQAQAEVAELQQRLGRKHREHEDLKQLYETAKSDLEIAFRRAARFKQTLDETKAPADREKALQEAYLREKQRADIEASKVEILEYELDIAQSQQEEESPPLKSANDERNAAFERVRRAIDTSGRRPRMLIVGGAGKQRSHRERDFEELKKKLGVEGEWRFADYGSWHRELPRLRNDIQHRFDLVFVLHWNRTTFVQKMHDEARALNGRVRTVPYRGFLSLERAVVEEVDRFVNERA